MDYTKIPRNLIYRDRKGLNEFIEGNNLNAVIVDNMQDVDVLMMDDFEARALTCLNAAYYICTLILMEEHPEWRIPFFIDYPRKLEKYHTDKFQIVILSLVVIFLEHLDEQWQQNHERIIERIKTHIDDSTLYSGTIDTHGSQFTAEKLDYIFQSLVSGTNQDFILSDKDFAPRNILDEDISVLDIVEWSEYSIETLKKTQTPSRKNKAIDSLLYRLDKIGTTLDLQFENKRKELKGVLEYFVKPAIIVTPLVCESLKQSAIKKRQSETKEQTELQLSVDDISGEMRVELAKAHKRIKELERQLEKTEALKAENERLQNDLEAFKTRDGKVRMTANQAAIFVQTVCHHLGGLPNDKKKLAPILESFWGYTHYTAEKALGGGAKQDVANEIASKFEETSPKLARLIREFPNEFDKLRKEKLKANNDNKVKKD